MRYIDLHCDTISELRNGESFKTNERHLDIEKIREAGVLVQCCSMFVPTGLLGDPSIVQSEFDRIYNVYEREMKDNQEDLRKILIYEDIKECMIDGKTGIMLTIEDAGVLNNSIDAVFDVYQKGVRLITLTWNHENEWAYPNSDMYQLMNLGLKPTGKMLVDRMFKIGMMVDVSHLSDGGFYDVAELSKENRRPFVASHSNAREITDHPRNMSDHMIYTLAECGGVMGLNLAPHFLSKAEAPNGNSRVEDMVKHIMHIRNVGGSEILAIGSDFDGIEGKLEISKPSEFEKLWDALSKEGIPSSELDKMWQLNALRVFKDVLF